MNSIIDKIIAKIYKRRLEEKKFSRILRDKMLRNSSVEFRHLFREIAFILLGILSASFGLKGFLLPNSFLDGGVTGVSLIMTALTVLPLSIYLVIINIPFMFLGIRAISGQFAARSISAIILLALAVHFIPFPVMTDDSLLISVFGGFFLGLGTGLAIRGGAVIDGTEVLAVFISRKSILSIGDVILIFNVIIFTIAAYIFSSEIALYAILTYLSASKTVDYVVDGIEEYIGVTIISDECEEIRLAIIENLGRGCTIYSGKKGFAQRGEPLKPTDIIYTLITRLEMTKLQKEIDKVDKNAFIIMHTIKDARGGMIKKKPLKK